MISYIVVEDDKNFQEREKQVINKVTFNVEEDIKILTFSTFSKELKQVISNNSEKKVYILDIELSGSVSGIQIAQLIRENDWDSEIIFCTSHDKMFEKTYRSVYAVFDFIEKFHEFEERLEKDLNVIMSKKHDNKMFKYHSRYVDLHLYMKEINYIYRDTDARKLVICTDTSKFEINKSISSMIQLLDNRFKICHRACIINTHKIKRYNWSKGYFTLSNGENVYLLSKKYKTEVIK